MAIRIDAAYPRVNSLSLSNHCIGAKKVKKECTQFQEYCKVENIDGCVRTFKEVKQEHATLKRKLENYFQLVREARLHQSRNAEE
ncbi:histidine-containing phosphotransfer protein 4-like [Salvia splendens]|uniref:histidine-containing phosphotransfer protein 4-like n=1 Tax=Salvia splendens TaxID=180675 RepID=UPI001C260C78|nr:histidine-containing phosphotransfer protein 4-like [Salvia splendens]XP_042038561.1 histidine-containing phosphotransfer protein 4-like [Salvia splendens]XP_042038562.1 histidine-containing phosphotransfer protein 4-like [Salvia splendens]XP_042038563.1 histidine-containing phosphotransfer protein 4-like [Salvia splendens]XP_042038564.1 histidine-containing phosphotransfer protein 4-like [Salvia splendens]